MRCPGCQADNRPTAKFCEACGTKLEAACPSCGAALSGAGKFCAECGAPVARPAATRFAEPQTYTPAHLAARILQERSALAGERKQVTVLFADVSGFTSLSERLDPEDVHALINRAFELMLAEVHRYEGTVNQFLGDGLMALFGAPIAHEDHALRAAHAALGMQAALARYRDELARTRAVEFRVRFGLNTGLVVVGAIGDNLRMDYTAVGDTTNTAARMQQLAEPGQIALAEATERLVAPYAEVRALGTFTVKNRAEPVRAWELVRMRTRVSRLAARTAHGLSPFVGRDDALATLERAFAAARSGRGQAAFVIGEAGIGKSRLLLEFRERVQDSATWVEGDCVSFGQSVAFMPVVDMLKRNFGVEDVDDEAQIVAKIQRGVQFLGDAAAGVAPYLRYLLAVDPGDAAVAAMDAVQRRARIVAALQGLTAAASRQRPLVLVVEDAHWIDSASEDYLKALAEALPGIAVLLVITYRPVYQQPFGERTYYWRLALQPVDDEDAVRIVRATVDIPDLPRELAERIAVKADGNPFFLEEIGRSLVETGAVRAQDGKLVLARAAASIAVPDTVQDVIAARLDRLAEPQKRTVQTASVIGREFALSLLQRVSDVHSALERSLNELKRIELIYEKIGFGDLEYVFRHALTQDVAYASLLQAERRRLHAVIGRAIEEVYAGRLEERTEELVHHFARGEAWEKTAHYARLAAERAAGLCVDARAVEFYEQALDALARLPETPERARLGIDVRLGMRVPLWRAGRLDPLFARFKEAEALAERHGETERLDSIFSFLVQYHWAKGEQERAIEYGERCLAIADRRQDLGLRVTALYYLSQACKALGRFPAAIDHARAILQSVRSREHERFGLSSLPVVGASALAALSLVELGDTAGALAFLERARPAAETADHAYTSALLAATHGRVLTTLGRYADALPHLETAIVTCRAKNFTGQLMLALFPLGAAYAATGRPAEGVLAAREAVALQENTEAFVERSIMLNAVGQALLAAGRLDEAATAAHEGLVMAERHGERPWEGYLHATLGDIALARGDRAVAEAEYDAAQEIAEELAMRPLLERCRAGLGRLVRR